MEMICKYMWKCSAGKITNTEKNIFSSLQQKCTRLVNNHFDENGLYYTQEAKIITGLALNKNVLWETTQLTLHLHQIIGKHRSLFDAARSEAMSPQ